MSWDRCLAESLAYTYTVAMSETDNYLKKKFSTLAEGKIFWNLLEFAVYFFFLKIMLVSLKLMKF